MTKFIFILPCLLLMYQPINAKVEAPNYDFSLKTLDDFFPGKSPKELDAKLGKGESMGKEYGTETLKYYVTQIRYKFPVLVQTSEDQISDFFARLPSYFLHDLFFQSLVNRYGKQKTYKKYGEEAQYTWEVSGNRHIYSATCTITCFPVFYAVEKMDSSNLSILEKMKKANKN